ncbi:hypothetical protein KFL_003280100 [Klebsormidium nitens]|uniref:Uncharacterized protein n=1 Tax=Klebsormidium nitens TaxID=105231 RepID=A0A1Y1IED6_KLENI|nr:hypothetical protein KFL_003280100 [Klebsormidium nitens]|eukprot:GAQ87056.1 hypothetical protein KFL_003280100 [Klebsormidium nitens]
MSCYCLRCSRTPFPSPLKLFNLGQNKEKAAREELSRVSEQKKEAEDAHTARTKDLEKKAELASEAEKRARTLVSSLKRDLEILGQKEECSRSEATAVLAGRTSLLDELKEIGRLEKTYEETCEILQTRQSQVKIRQQAKVIQDYMVKMDQKDREKVIELKDIIISKISTEKQIQSEAPDPASVARLKAEVSEANLRYEKTKADWEETQEKLKREIAELRSSLDAIGMKPSSVSRGTDVKHLTETLNKGTVTDFQRLKLEKATQSSLDHVKISDDPKGRVQEADTFTQSIKGESIEWKTSDLRDTFEEGVDAWEDGNQKGSELAAPAKTTPLTSTGGCVLTKEGTDPDDAEAQLKEASRKDPENIDSHARAHLGGTTEEAAAVSEDQNERRSSFEHSSVEAEKEGLRFVSEQAAGDLEAAPRKAAETAATESPEDFQMTAEPKESHNEPERRQETGPPYFQNPKPSRNQERKGENELSFSIPLTLKDDRRSDQASPSWLTTTANEGESVQSGHALEVENRTAEASEPTQSPSFLPAARLEGKEADSKRDEESELEVSVPQDSVQQKKVWSSILSRLGKPPGSSGPSSQTRTPPLPNHVSEAVEPEEPDGVPDPRGAAVETAALEGTQREVSEQPQGDASNQERGGKELHPSSVAQDGPDVVPGEMRDHPIAAEEGNTTDPGIEVLEVLPPRFAAEGRKDVSEVGHGALVETAGPKQEFFAAEVRSEVEKERKQEEKTRELASKTEDERSVAGLLDELGPADPSELPASAIPVQDQDQAQAGCSCGDPPYGLMGRKLSAAKIAK